MVTRKVLVIFTRFWRQAFRCDVAEKGSDEGLMLSVRVRVQAVLAIHSDSNNIVDTGKAI